MSPKGAWKFDPPHLSMLLSGEARPETARAWGPRNRLFYPERIVDQVLARIGASGFRKARRKMSVCDGR